MLHLCVAQPASFLATSLPSLLWNTHASSPTPAVLFVLFSRPPSHIPPHFLHTPPRVSPSPLQSSSYAAVWAADAPAFTTKLRTRSSTLGVPWALQDVSWELSLGIGSSGATSVKETSTTLEFTLGKEGGRGSDDDIKRVPVAFTRQQLLAFLEKLDTVQQQVDALSS